jgi:hypothetical protein
LLRKDDIRFVKETIAPHAAPALSLYVDVNPSKPENNRRGWLVRVKDALMDLPIPREVRERLINKLATVAPEARTYVAFAASDLMEIYKLQVDLPLVNLAHGRVDARWGDPYVYPLLYVIDEFERHGVVFIDQSKWRFFDIFLGENRRDRECVSGFER